MRIVTRVTAIRNLNQYIGKDLAEFAPQFGIQPFKDGKQNKGWKGLVLERLAGLEANTLKAPNGLTYELKSVAFHEVQGDLTPKETMAITMINAEELKQQEFFDSHCWAKLRAVVFCAVEWSGRHAKNAKLLEVTSLDFAEDDELIQEIKADYDFIREKLIKEGFDALTGKDGKWIQARTKGPGGTNRHTGKPHPRTRAFYARTKLVKKIFKLAS